MLTKFEIGFLRSIVEASLHGGEMHIKSYKERGVGSEQEIKILEDNAQRKRDLILKLNGMVGAL